MKAPWSMFKGL